jgi:hypothetical protein
MKTCFRLSIIMLFFALILGCAHTVEFNPEPYAIQCARQDAGIIVVIDDDTLNKTVNMRSPLVGYAHSWLAKPGEWLKQIADTELPQMFQFYKYSKDYEEPEAGTKRLTVVMTVPNYTFYRFHANISVCVSVYSPGKNFVNQKTYNREGISQGKKMFWGGPFAMKSAVRTSTLDALKQIMFEVRRDLEKVLDSQTSTAEFKES